MSYWSRNLFLQEEILLLALNDKKGTFYMRNFLPAIAGAMVAELLLAGRIDVEEGRKKLINMVSRQTFGDPLLDEVLDKIATAKRRASLQTWIQRFSNIPKLQHRVAQGLCRRAILREDEQQILILFRQKIYPEVDNDAERLLIQHLHDTIFGENQEIEPRITVLLALANAADLLSIPFDRKELKGRKKRIKSIVNGDLIGEATKEAVEAVQAAIAAAAIVPIITAYTSSSS
ncbi:MAG: GPP34 family phosphoprotein [Candidatus Latescibacteria bacterium]|nr:GPP34 family phosphoprotein [Candidatus Latescibacterota bacterium]